MKRLISIFLVTAVLCSFLSIAAFAEEQTSEKTEAEEYEFNWTLLFLGTILQNLEEANAITEEGFAEILSVIDYDYLYETHGISDDIYEAFNSVKEGYKSLPNNYSFSQGTFVVGTDLKAGTYDVTCTSSSDEGLSGSMSEFGDLYSSFGMEEYADMFGSLGEMYEGIGGLSVEIIGKDGYTDKYLTIKVGETARIILEDGMKLELSDGTADLTFVR